MSVERAMSGLLAAAQQQNYLIERIWVRSGVCVRWHDVTQWWEVAVFNDAIGF
jgi:hypothetical protein